MTELLQFAFIVVLPLIIVGGAVASLFAIGALFEALEDPQGLRSRIEAAFRRPPNPPKTPGRDHYYKPYWQSP